MAQAAIPEILCEGRGRPEGGRGSRSRAVGQMGQMGQMGQIKPPFVKFCIKAFLEKLYKKDLLSVPSVPAPPSPGWAPSGVPTSGPDTISPRMTKSLRSRRECPAPPHLSPRALTLDLSTSCSPTTQAKPGWRGRRRSPLRAPSRCTAWPRATVRASASACFPHRADKRNMR
jgi:hypothetical protein